MPSAGPSGPGHPRGRLDWPDIAKGGCVFLVVLHHVVGKVYVDAPYALVAPDSVLATAWMGLSAALKPVRLPVFFVLSGLFATRVVNGPRWPAMRRVAGSYYLYVVWLLVLVGVFTVETSLELNRPTDLLDLGRDLLFASTEVWYLYALTAYLAVATLIRRVPRSAILVLAALLCASTSMLPIEATNRRSVLFHFVFFAVGALYPEVVRRFSVSPWSLRALVPAFVALSVLAGLTPAPRSLEILVVSVVGVPTGIAVAVRVGAWDTRDAPRLGASVAAVAALGRRTLPVYVLHMPLMAAFSQVPLGPGDPTSAWSTVAAAVHPLVYSLLLVASSLLVYEVAIRIGGGFLFTRPFSAPVRARTPSALSAGRARRAGPVPLDTLEDEAGQVSRQEVASDPGHRGHPDDSGTRLGAHLGSGHAQSRHR